MLPNVDMPFRQPLLFIDFEASGLRPGCYPIEFGWAASGDFAETGSLLIRPVPTWTDWDPNAEAMHGISRARLEVEGLSVVDAAARIVELGRERVIVSDQPGWDGGWLGEVLAEAGVEARLPVIALEDAVR